MNTDNEDKIVYLPRLGEMIQCNYPTYDKNGENKILTPEEIKGYYDKKKQ